MGDASDFLGALTAGAPDDLFGYLWTPQPRKSHWFQVGEGVERPVDLALGLAESTDVYVGVSASTTDRGPSQRLTYPAVAGIFGLWADIDWADADVHKKINLPPSPEAAQEVIDSCGVKPSITVRSGHGFQCWWLFDEFWLFDDESDRSNAAALAERWHSTLLARAMEHNWTLDSVFDLTRLLRLPGTRNHKVADDVLDVTIEMIEDGRRFGVEDFEAFILDAPDVDRSTSRRTYVVDEFVLDPDVAEPVKAQVMRVNDDTGRFAASMDRKRPDFRDQSMSSYDMSLATICANAGWEDQEIVDLLVSNRRRHGEDLKLRPDYYRRTLIAAHDQARKEAALGSLNEAGVILEEARATGDPDEEKKARRDHASKVSDALGFDIAGFYRLLLSPFQFEMRLSNGLSIGLGTIKGITDQKTFRDTILASDLGTLVPTFKAEEWKTLSHQMRNLAEDRDVGMEGTDQGAMQVWLDEFLLDRTPVSDREDALATQYPFFDERGRVCIFLGPFRRWLWTQRTERIDVKEISRILRSTGAEPGKVPVTVDGQRSTRHIWVLPGGKTA